MPLKGQVAIVTAAGSKPGADRARELARDGASLALHYNSSPNKDETMRICDELAQKYPKTKISVHTCDLGTTAAIDQLFSETIEQHRRIDMVVNSTGTVLKKPAARSAAADHDEMLAYAVFVDEQRRRYVEQFHAESTRR